MVKSVGLSAALGAVSVQATRLMLQVYARGGTRTRTGLLPRDFKGVAAPLRNSPLLENCASPRHAAPPNHLIHSAFLSAVAGGTRP